MGDCQNYGPLLGPYDNNTGPNLGDPKRDPNLDNPPSGDCAGKCTRRSRRYCSSIVCTLHLSKQILVVEPSKIIFLI